MALVTAQQVMQTFSVHTADSIKFLQPGFEKIVHFKNLKPVDAKISIEKMKQQMVPQFFQILQLPTNDYGMLLTQCLCIVLQQHLQSVTVPNLKEMFKYAKQKVVELNPAFKHNIPTAKADLIGAILDLLRQYYVDLDVATSNDLGMNKATLRKAFERANPALKEKRLEVFMNELVQELNTSNCKAQLFEGICYAMLKQIQLEKASQEKVMTIFAKVPLQQLIACLAKQFKFPKAESPTITQLSTQPPFQRVINLFPVSPTPAYFFEPCFQLFHELNNKPSEAVAQFLFNLRTDCMKDAYLANYAKNIQILQTMNHAQFKSQILGIIRVVLDSKLQQLTVEVLRGLLIFLISKFQQFHPQYNRAQPKLKEEWIAGIQELLFELANRPIATSPTVSTVPFVMPSPIMEEPNKLLLKNAFKLANPDVRQNVMEEFCDKMMQKIRTISIQGKLVLLETVCFGILKQIKQEEKNATANAPVTQFALSRLRVLQGDLK